VTNESYKGERLVHERLVHENFSQVTSLHSADRIAGFGELDQGEILSRYQGLTQSIDVGLRRKGAPTTRDGGVMAVRTGIPLVTPQAWEAVSPGSAAVVVTVAGTNWESHLAVKGDDGDIVLTLIRRTPYLGSQRSVSYEAFIERIAASVMDVRSHLSEGSASIGVSFGFPHTNTATRFGIDAQLLSDTGRLPKGWELTDWNSVSSEQRYIGKALLSQLSDRGVTVNSLSVINDTAAVALDSGAALAAGRAGLSILPAGVVGGTGTNAAILNNGGLVNLELGHAPWPEDDVSRRMRDNGWAQGTSELEQETGMYLAYRLCAGLQLLGERGLISDGQQLAQETLARAQERQVYLSDLAAGETTPRNSNLLTELAQAVLNRAGQVYGVALASVASAVTVTGLPGKSAVLVEGAVLLTGAGIKKRAQETAAGLGHLVAITPASGLKGIASLVMAWDNARSSE
jgi:hypothetical protein